MFLLQRVSGWCELMEEEHRSRPGAPPLTHLGDGVCHVKALSIM